MATDDWKQSKDTQRMLHNFKQDNASNPPDLKEAKSYNNEIMNTVASGMKERGWNGRHEYTGSSYEGTKVNSGNEFDVMKVQKRDDLVVKPTHKSGFVKLEAKSGKQSTDKFVEKGYLSTDKYKSQFKGDVQKTVDSQLKGKVKVVDHGPAVQLDAHRSRGRFSHSTDYVPAVEVKGRIFVAKGGDDHTMWRESYSLKEKADLKSSDKGTLRTLKAMREQDAPLKTLDTYAYKNAVMHQSKTKGWDKKTDTEKATSTMDYMKGCITKGNMPSHSNKKINLLQGKSDAQLRNVGNRLGKLSTKEGDFKKVVSRSKKSK